MNPTFTLTAGPDEPATPTIDPDTEPGTQPGTPKRSPNPGQPNVDPIQPTQPDRETCPDEGPCPYRNIATQFVSCDGVADLTGMTIGKAA